MVISVQQKITVRAIMTSLSSSLITNCISLYVSHNLLAFAQLDKRMESRVYVCMINGPLSDYKIN